MKTEREILKYIIKIIDDLKEKSISIDRSEQVLFSPANIKKIKKITDDSRIIQVLYEGCELDDINDLIPDEYENVLSKLKKDASLLLEEYGDDGK